MRNQVYPATSTVTEQNSFLDCFLVTQLHFNVGVGLAEDTRFITEPVLYFRPQQFDLQRSSSQTVLTRAEELTKKSLLLGWLELLFRSAVKKPAHGFACRSGGSC